MAARGKSREKPNPETLVGPADGQHEARLIATELDVNSVVNEILQKLAQNWLNKLNLRPWEELRLAEELRSDVTIGEINEWTGIMCRGFYEDLTDEALGEERLDGQTDTDVVKNGLYEWLKAIVSYCGNPDNEKPLCLAGYELCRTEQIDSDAEEPRSTDTTLQIIVADEYDTGSEGYRVTFNVIQLLSAIIDRELLIITNGYDETFCWAPEDQTPIIGPLEFWDGTPANLPTSSQSIESK